MGSGFSITHFPSYSITKSPFKSAADLIDFLGHLYVTLRDSTGMVRHQRHGLFAVQNVDIRMMVGLLGGFGNLVHKLHGCLEVRELEHALDGDAVALPSRKPLERLLDFQVRQDCHFS